MVPWTGHVIFGLYFVVLAFVIPAVRPLHESLGPHPKQALVLLVLGIPPVKREPCMNRISRLPLQLSYKSRPLRISRVVAFPNLLSLPP